MEPVTFAVDGEEVPVEAIWVHFQGAVSPDAKPFTLTVPSVHVKGVFDPHGNCPPSVPLDAYLMDLISELGTFVVGGYVRSIRQLLQREQAGHQWVIATVEDVKDTGTAMVLRGKVVPFVPVVPTFKKLE